MALALAISLLWALPGAAAQGHQVDIRVISASEATGVIDPKLADLAKDLTLLKFASFILLDRMVLSLELGKKSRMQLPDKGWMTLQPTGVTDDGKLRLMIEVKEPAFKATVAISGGASVVIPGPARGDSRLILAIRRVTKP